MEKLTRFYALLLTLGLLLSTDSLPRDWAIQEAERQGYGPTVVGMAGTILVLLAIVLMLLGSAWAGRECQP